MASERSEAVVSSGRSVTVAVLFDADAVNEMKRFFVEISDFQSIITLGTKY